MPGIPGRPGSPGRPVSPMAPIRPVSPRSPLGPGCPCISLTDVETGPGGPRGPSILNPGGPWKISANHGLKCDNDDLGNNVQLSEIQSENIWFRKVSLDMMLQIMERHIIKARYRYKSLNE